MEQQENKVKLMCVKEGGKLRVRITSEGYLNTANCQFPRNIRVEGREYEVPPSAITLRKGPRGKYFYRVDGKKVGTPTAEVVKPEKVFGDDEDPVCIICMDAPKTLVLVPCGHYCVCIECVEPLKKKCPLCRSNFTSFIDRSLVE